MSEKYGDCAVQQCVSQLLRGVEQKQNMAASLLQLAARQRQIISLLPVHGRILPHVAYRKYLHQQSYLVVKLRDRQQPIWLSDNLQLTDWSAAQSFQNSLESDVHQLHDNLAKYENVIASLKELKEMQQLEKQQELFNKNAPNREEKLKKYIVTLEHDIFDSRSQIKKLKVEKDELLSKLLALQEKENERKQLRALQNRFRQCNKEALSQPPAKRKHKKILINY